MPFNFIFKCCKKLKKFILGKFKKANNKPVGKFIPRYNTFVFPSRDLTNIHISLEAPLAGTYETVSADDFLNSLSSIIETKLTIEVSFGDMSGLVDYLPNIKLTYGEYNSVLRYVEGAS